jgi:hypothetical protein
MGCIGRVDGRRCDVSRPVGCWCRCRALPQSGLAWLRFLPPLIEPDVRNYRIRLSPIPSDLRPRQVVQPHWHVVSAERSVEVLVRDLGNPGASLAGAARQPATDPPLSVFADELVGVENRALVEVSTPAA